MNENIIFSTDLQETLKHAEILREKHEFVVINELLIITALCQERSSYLSLFLKKHHVPREKINHVLNKFIKEAERFYPKPEEIRTLRIVYSKRKSPIELPINQEIKILLTKAKDFADFYGNYMITSSHLTMALISLMPEDLKKFLGEFKEIVSCTDMQKDIIDQSESFIPTKLKKYLTLLNSKVTDTEKCEILGRETETDELIKILIKQNKQNAILIGDAGVGKTAIMEKLIWQIVAKKCPKQFENYNVISLDVSSIIAGTKYRGDAEKHFQELIRFLEMTPNVILFIDEIHLLLGAGACKDGDIDLANALKPILARGITRVVGATTTEEYEKYFSKDTALKRRFQCILVREPKINEVKCMIKNKVKKLEKEHNVKISSEMVDFCISTAVCYDNNTKNPDKTLDLIDNSMAIANLKGKKEITREIVLSNYEERMKTFSNIPINVKITTADHEVGHFLIQKFSDLLVDRKVIAITIIPDEHNFCGCNVLEPTNSYSANYTRMYFIHEIAFLLAGKVAEKMYSSTVTSGPSEDLKRATEIAKSMITEYGMSKNLYSSRTYLQEKEQTIITEDIVKAISNEVNEILQEAYTLCEKILREHATEVYKLVDALLEKGVLSEEDIEEIIQTDEM